MKVCSRFFFSEGGVSPGVCCVFWPMVQKSYDVTINIIWSRLVCGRILKSSVVDVFNQEIIAI